MKDDIISCTQKDFLCELGGFVGNFVFHKAAKNKKNNRNMNTAVRKEIEDFIVSGRRKSEVEFDQMLDEYFQDKTEKDKEEISEALSDFFSNRMRQFIEVENKLKQYVYGHIIIIRYYRNCSRDH